MNCDGPTTGVFSLFGSPVYSTYEDSAVHGDVMISGVRSCWMGVIREDVSGSMTINNNKMADPDAMEINSNQIAGDLTCMRNSMAWDSSEASKNPRGCRSRTRSTEPGSASACCPVPSPITVHRGPDPSNPGRAGGGERIGRFSADRIVSAARSSLTA